MITGRTRVFALLGQPVAHSLSPVIHNAAFAALGLDAVYAALNVSAAEVAPLMMALARAGGGGNVTVPYKRLAAQSAPASAPMASCNTFWGDGDRLALASTDGAGIRAGWERLGRPGGAWLIVGTGGSALAAAVTAREVGAGVLVRSRTPERAAAFQAEIASLGIAVVTGQVGMVVNCTPLGLKATDPLPVPIDKLPAGAAALDLVYQRGETPWVRAVRAAGRLGFDGRSVLLGQAAAAFRHWFPTLDPPVDVMGAALERALR